MKESIFRALSGCIGLIGFASTSTVFAGLFSWSVADFANISACMAFVLYAAGGPKLLRTLPLTPFLNEKAGRIFSANRPY